MNLLLLFSSTFYCQKVSPEIVINDIIENTLVQDIYYYLDFAKQEIPLPKLFYSLENIPLKANRFNKDYIPEIRNIDYIDFSEISNSKEKSRYIVFNTGLIDNSIVMVEVFFLRDEFLNVANPSEYETWRRYNAGISYLFVFNNEGCLTKLKKRGISYD